MVLYLLQNAPSHHDCVKPSFPGRPSSCDCFGPIVGALFVCRTVQGHELEGEISSYRQKVTGPNFLIDNLLLQDSPFGPEDRITFIACMGVQGIFWVATL